MDRSNGTHSTWDCFSFLWQHLGDSRARDDVALQQFIQKHAVHFSAIPELHLPSLRPKSTKLFWEFVREHDWLLPLLERAEQRNGMLFFHELQQGIPPGYTRKRWKHPDQSFLEALRLLLWMWMAEERTNLRLAVDDGTWYPTDLRQYFPPGKNWHLYLRCTDQELKRRVRERYIIYYLPLVRNTVGRLASHYPSHVDPNDLLQEGVTGLIESLERFDPDRNFKFETYAVPRIRGAVLDFLRESDWAPRSVRQQERARNSAETVAHHAVGRKPHAEEIAAIMGIELREYHHFAAATGEASLLSLDEMVFREEDNRSIPRVDLVQSLSSELALALVGRKPFYEALYRFKRTILSPQQRSVIDFYYWHELTLKEIGREMRICESRVSQIHTSAVFRLQCAFNEAYGIPYRRISPSKRSLFEPMRLPSLPPQWYGEELKTKSVKRLK